MKTHTYAQHPIKMEIKESFLNDQVISHIVKITNTSETAFKGELKYESNIEVSSLSRNNHSITIAPGDSSFYAFRHFVGKNASAGTKIFNYLVLDENGATVVDSEMDFQIDVREHIYLQIDETPILLTNPYDSVRIAVTVNNLGNISEEVTLVFNIPELREAPQFTEMKSVVTAMSQNVFTFSFIPSVNLLNKPQFPVHITAMKGKGKEIFSNKRATVQNVSSDRRFSNINPMQSMFSGYGSYDNSVSLSYRHYNTSSSMMQLEGGGYYNLPAGYLTLKGNLYRYNGMQNPILTNTSLMYKLFENEYTVGNISEQLELPLFGRGAKVKFSDNEKNKTISFGAIDQNYNLISSQPWFKNYYSFYTEVEIGANNNSNGTKATYLFQRNPYDKADYHVGSLEWRSDIGKNWNINLATHASASNYDVIEDNKFSGAVELRYRGNINERVILNGSGYYSDPYFAGSRRGTTNFNQSINIGVNDDINISGNVGYNKMEPKSYSYEYNYFSENINTAFFVSVPKVLSVSSSFLFRHHSEASSAYSYYLEDNSDIQSINSNLLGWQWRWQSRKMKHSLYGTIEGGFLNDPLNESMNNLLKATLHYSYSWLNLNLSYQDGAYYIYEYMMANRLNRDFYRFTASVSANKNISKKINLNSGLNFTRDVYQGNVPSVNLNINWKPSDKVSLFMSGYWHRYPLIYNKDIFNIQLGVTYNFSKTQPSSGKNSNITAQLYYDYNSNNRYDENDVPAEDYLIRMDKTVFMTDSEGKVSYSHVPYGSYSMKPAQSNRWFFDQKVFDVSSSKTMLNIPLKQNGTITGKVEYVEGEFSVDIVPRYEGIRFIISNSDNTISRTVITDGSGKFITFLPNGDYTIQLDKKTLLEHTDCIDFERNISIEAGKTTNLDNFIIEVKERKVNVRRFVN